MEEFVMKKTVLAAVCILTGMLFVAVAAFAYTGGNGIKTTPHDLSTLGEGASYGDTTEHSATGQDRICVYCHAPHNTIKAVDAAGIAYIPLWNHKVTTQTYVLYSNGSELPGDTAHQSQAMVLLAGKNQPGSVSRLCLSCHDGTVSTNAYGFYGASSKGADNVKIISGSPYMIGGNGDLSNHHPIGFNYNAAQGSDAGLAPVTTAVYGGKNISNLLWNNNMECTTCHDVHNTGNDPLGNKFLWKNDRQSNFCLTCHLKDGAGHP
jgi:predicted CXXCH cytochrome family protein